MRQITDQMNIFPGPTRGYLNVSHLPQLEDFKMAIFDDGLGEIQDYIGPEELANYLTARYGYDFILWDDGATSIVPSSNQKVSQDRIYARVQCPGIDQLEVSAYTVGYCHWDTDVGAYVVDEHHDDGGRIIGDFASLVREHCIDRDANWLLVKFILDLEIDAQARKGEKQ